MTSKLGFRRCKSDPNLYCHDSGKLYVLAFLGRRLRRNGDSIDVCISQTYIDSILDLYGMKNAKQVATTGSVTTDTPLSPEEHSVHRTAVGKLLWLALIRGNVAYATKELSRDVTAPTMQSVAKLKHLLRYLIGTKMCVLRLRRSYQLSDGNSSLDVNVYVDSDWAGCSKTRKSTSGSTVNILGCNMVSTARTQGTLALLSGEAELYAIGQGVSEALFLRSMLLEAKLAKKVNVTAHTDPTAGKSMATRSGTGKKTKHVELRNDFPVESLHLMNETLTTHRFSRNGPVNREVSAALSRMDMSKDVTKVWQRLDEYVTTDSQTECDKIAMDACEIANRLNDAQVGLAEAVYRREWNDEWAPILSLLIPGTRSGGLSGCRFEHPDEHSNGPMSSE
eukprot:s532_g10.t1